MAKVLYRKIFVKEIRKTRPFSLFAATTLFSLLNSEVLFSQKKKKKLCSFNVDILFLFLFRSTIMNL